MDFSTIIKRISLVSIMSALYAILAFLNITTNDFQLSFASFVLIFVSLALPLQDALAVAIIGTFIEQLKFGLGITTILWMLPSIIRVLFISLINLIFIKNNKFLYQNKTITIFVIVLSSIVVTFLNTIVMYLDSLIYNYPLTIVFLQTILRACNTILISIVECILIFYLIEALTKANFLPIDTKIKRRIKNG